MKDAGGKPVTVNDVVQLAPTPDNGFFPGCFMLVTEVYYWGVQGFICMPHSQNEAPGQAYFRAKSENFLLVGVAPWIPKPVEEEPQENKEFLG